MDEGGDNGTTPAPRRRRGRRRQGPRPKVVVPGVGQRHPTRALKTLAAGLVAGHLNNRTVRRLVLQTLSAAAADAAAILAEYERPQTRADCLPRGCNEQRPCPWAGCQHHLYLDVNPETGALKLNFPDLEVDQLRETCALDVADRGGVTLEDVGEIMNLTRERIRQVEVRGLLKLKMSMPTPEEDEAELVMVRRLTPRASRKVERVERTCLLPTCRKTFLGTLRDGYCSEECRIAGRKLRAERARQRSS